MVTVVDGLRLRRLIAGTVLRHRIGRVRLFEAAVGAVPLVFVGPSGAAIVVPRGLSPDARRAVLRYVMAARLVCAWNPAFWIWQLLHDHATERACDQAVLDRRNVTREVYLSSLLEVARATVRAAPTVRVAAALLGRTTLQMVSFRSRALHIAIPLCESGGWRMPGLCTIALAVVLGIAGLTELDVRAWSVQSLHRATQLNLHLNPAGERIHAFGLVMAY
jgi:hypothetical protein